MQLDKLLFTINVAVDMLGVLFFVSLILVTLKHKTLRGNCHLLIGLYAVCCLCSKTIIILPYLIALLFQSIPFYLCLAIEIWPLLPHLDIPPLMLFIGIDRVLSVFFPIWYSTRIEGKFYVSMIFALSFIYPIFLGTFMLKNAIEKPTDPMHCDFTELVGDDGTELFTFCSFFFNISTICCYLLIAAKLIWMSQKGQTSQVRFALYKSITLIMAIQTGGWMLSNMGYAFIRMMAHLDDQTKSILICIVNYLSSLSSTMEVPAIYFSSSEHRNAYKKEFRWILKLFVKKKAIKSRIKVQIISRNVLASTIMPPRGIGENAVRTPKMEKENPTI